MNQNPIIDWFDDLPMPCEQIMEANLEPDSIVRQKMLKGLPITEPTPPEPTPPATPQIDGTKQALVLKVGERFYSSHTRKRIVTAWSLAGACLFLPGAGISILDIEEMLIKKGYKPMRKLISIID